MAGEREELFVRNAAPEEKRKSRRELEVVDAVVVPGCRLGRCFLEAEYEVRTGQDGLERRANPFLEAICAALRGSFLVEAHQPVAIMLRKRPTIGARSETRDDLVGACRCSAAR